MVFNMLRLGTKLGKIWSFCPSIFVGGTFRQVTQIHMKIAINMEE